MEIALAITAPRRLADLAAIATLDRAALLRFLPNPTIEHLLAAGATASHLYFGSEYCEHLFPRDRELATAIEQAERLGLRFVLATPIASDRLLERITVVLERLPEASEVVANDWGVATLIATHFPQHRVVAGRQLVKMVKDPRMPAPAWNKVYPSGYRAGAFARLLSTLGIRQLELDVPPFASADVFAVDDLAVSVWAPYAYIAKGRICKVGSLSKQAEEKFRPGAQCRRECLGILEQEADAAGVGLRAFRRGTTMFYEHDSALNDALRDAIARGHVSRLVLCEV